MTYPPQQPGPYGQQPQPGGYGNQPGNPPQPGGYGPPQPDGFAQQPAYQGFGGYPGGGEPPRKNNNTGKIVAIVAIAVLVLGGAGVGVYFLTKDSGDKPAASAPPSTTKQPSTSSSDEPETTSRRPSSTRSSDAGPEAVAEAYMKAYEDKHFAPVVTNSCSAYQKKYGTDTSELEKSLSDYEITATLNGSPQVSGSTATVKIDLDVVRAGETKETTIAIKVIKEGGEWKFCGEEKA
ncbi:hypothetical protein [Actinokineospora iranica]|uniref:DUF4878 domain-containing protein n=1 Tax=Actinokineospora iranica TaxID=1271860 RepID=A0A1G6IWU4_9PSEU|nr:hypothetical protein [Actinokineospora iranica]SDC11042.1 hypothetical protein SAMN05216174_101137 [Actinokineospora iranica]